METPTEGAYSPTTSPPPSQLEAEKDFIITFESLSILWDKTHQYYVNKYKRNEALEKLLIIYKKVKPLATTEDVKKKINTLRSNYRRERKKYIQSRRSGAGTDEVYTPRSWTFEYLRFLDKVEKPQAPESDNEEDRHSSDRVQPQAQQGSESQETSFSRSTGSISSVNAVLSPSTRPTKIKKELVAKQNELLDRACAYLSEPRTNSNSIAFEWADTLDRLDPTQRLYAKKAINDVLFEAELGNLSRYSVQIHIPVPSPNHSNPSVTSPHPSPYFYNNVNESKI